MTINHHPDQATLISYSAGSLSSALALLVECHLEHCSECRQRVREAENLGAQLLASQPTEQVDEDGFFARLTETEQLPPQQAISGRKPRPKMLQALLAKGEAEVPWRWRAPGLHSYDIKLDDSRLKLLRIAPGTHIPVHSHSQSEVTMVLAGAYQDELGCFRAGDVADLDDETAHQPHTLGSEPCVCLVALEGPLRFQQLLPRLLQPFMGL
ncbi:MAG: ChrR family anti-sigma-E factor [Cellvibrionaceae bacterium]|nr:ChrR family anti-sigma-E factor [Cellvibrionaceae bacterium]MCV6626042.1 ChrR family anti-sigma-E factor [Cellvibrionaceae bacterium]